MESGQHRMRKTIAVVVPAYNAKKYLRQCIESVLNQTFQDFCLVLVDDGSTDGSGQICDAYAAKDRRIQVIHQPNKGSVETSVEPDLPEAAIEPDLLEPEPSEPVVANEPEEPADAQDAAAPVSVNADEAGDVNSLFGAVEDVHKAHRKGLNDRAVSVKAVMDMKPEKPEWYTAIPGPEVKDIRSAISLNDRVMFITTLFRDDSMLFQDVVSKVNAMTSLDKVADYLTSTFPEWDMYSDMVYRFMMAVRRKLR